jgi:hypothetical protein
MKHLKNLVVLAVSYITINYRWLHNMSLAGRII